MNPARIELIGDHPGGVRLVEMALNENGIPYHLRLFENGTEAVKVLRAPAEPNASLLEAIPLDLNTPGSDGFHVLVQVTDTTARLWQVPIAVLTSSQASSDERRAALQGVRYIQKPSQTADFLAAVGRAVNEMLHQ